MDFSDDDDVDNLPDFEGEVSRRIGANQSLKNSGAPKTGSGYTSKQQSMDAGGQGGVLQLPKAIDLSGSDVVL